MPNTTRAFLPMPLDPRMDPANLAQFGEVIDLMSGKNRPSVWSPSALMQMYISELNSQGYDPSRDYIVLTGRALYLVMLIRSLRKLDTIKVLMFDSPSSKYHALEI